MANDLVDAALISGQVAEITGNFVEGLKAGAYSSWVKSVSGSLPKVLTLPGDRVRLTWNNPEQIAAMQSWLDGTLQPAKTPPVIEYDLGPVLKPWITKKAVPYAILLFIAGAASYWAYIKFFAGK